MVSLIIILNIGFPHFKIEPDMSNRIKDAGLNHKCPVES